MPSSYCVIYSLTWSSTTVFILMMPHRRTRRSAGHSSKGIPSRSENATPPVSTTPRTQSSHRTDSTSGVGSARPPAKQQRRNQPTSQSPEEAASSRPLTAQDVPTIVQAILDALPCQTGTPTPMQSSNAEVAPSPGTSGDDVPSKLLVS